MVHTFSALGRFSGLSIAVGSVRVRGEGEERVENRKSRVLLNLEWQVRVDPRGRLLRYESDSKQVKLTVKQLNYSSDTHCFIIKHNMVSEDLWLVGAETEYFCPWRESNMQMTKMRLLYKNSRIVCCSKNEQTAKEHFVMVLFSKDQPGSCCPILRLCWRY